jgi:hypothetical protein
MFPHDDGFIVWLAIALCYLEYDSSAFRLTGRDEKARRVAYRWRAILRLTHRACFKRLARSAQCSSRYKSKDISLFVSPVRPTLRRESRDRSHAFYFGPPIDSRSDQ